MQALIAASEARRTEVEQLRARELAARAGEARARRRVLTASGMVVAALALGSVAVYQWLRADGASVKAQQSADKAQASADEALASADLADQQRARAEDLLRSTETSAASLSGALVDMRHQAMEATTLAGLRADVLRASRQFDTVADRLAGAAQQAVQAAPVGNAVQGATTLRPLVYVQYADPAQKDAVQRQQALQKQRVGGVAINAPGVEARPTSTSRHLLRCFRAAECRDDAPQVLAALNALLDSPRLELDNASARYENAPGIRPRQYEVWFAAGEIRLSASAAAPK